VHLEFLEEYLDSLEKLEFMHHVRMTREAARSDLKTAFPLDDEMVRTMTRELVQCGLLERSPDNPDMLRLGPLSLSPTCETIMAAYETDRVVVLSALSSIAMGRIRNMAARTFAEAFVLKKRRKDDDDG
jgi:hypothetical protein